MHMNLNLGAKSYAKFQEFGPVDNVAPSLTMPMASANGGTALSATVMTTEDNGPLHWYVSQLSAAPSAGDLVAGTSAAAFGNIAISSAGMQMIPVTGLPTDTTYFVHFLHIDNAGNPSNIASTPMGVPLSNTLMALTSATRTSDIGRPPEVQLGFAADFSAGMYVIGQLADDNGFTVQAPVDTDAAGKLNGWLLPITTEDLQSPSMTPASVRQFLQGMQLNESGGFARFRPAQDPDPYIAINQGPWSDPIPVPIYDFVPGTFAFTDQNDIAISTQVESDSITLADVTPTANAQWTVTGGEARVNGGAYATSGTINLGDQIQLRTTSSANQNEKVDVVLMIEGVADTWSVTTVTSLPLPQAGALGVFLRADDLASMFQTVGGATAVAADGDPVGTWTDQSSATYDMTAIGDDGTRPVYRDGGGTPYLEFNGTSSVLRRLQAMNLWDPQGYTMMIAMRSVANGTSRYLVAGGNGSQSNTIMQLAASSSGAAANSSTFYRSDTGANVMAGGDSVIDGAFDGTDRVATIVDDGSSVTGYLDGTLSQTRNYVRGANVLTVDRLALGALVRNGAPALHFPARVYGLAIWPTVNLSAADLAAANTFLGSLQGRTI